MTADDVDAYLSSVPEPHRSTLTALRRTIAALLPEADEEISYGVPCFKVAGVGVAGLGYAKNQCSYYPMSGSITAELAADLVAYKTSKGAIAFPPDEPLPTDLVKKLIRARQREIAEAR